MAKKLTTKDFIKKAAMIHSGRYDYSLVEYKNSQSKVIIICNKHGQFIQTPAKHLAGSGCKQCKIRKSCNPEKYSTEGFIKRAKLIDNGNCDYSSTKYIKDRIGVDIFCLKHKLLFNIIPASFLAGHHGCPECSYEKRRDSQTLSLNEVINNFQKTHGNLYDYSQVEYISQHTKIKIICHKHGEFFQKPNSHAQGAGCRKCGEEKLSIFFSSSKEEFILKAQNIHNNLYDYSLVKYKNNNIHINIICKKHGVFKQTPHSHLCGKGCYKCGKEHLSKLYTMSLEDFIEKSNIIHNNYYDYSLSDYKGSKIDLKIICTKHGVFNQKPGKHLLGHGCIKCTSSISGKEVRWLNYINIPEQFRHVSIRINGKIIKPDAFDPNTNTVYEFYGDYWHGNPNIFNPNDTNLNNKTLFGTLHSKTIDRENIIKNAGYNLITIWESDFNKIY